jgi:ribosomal protein L3 glutamine methyltransferase
MWGEALGRVRTIRDVLRFAISRFQAAGLAFGHGTDNAFDEAAYLILHALHLQAEQLDTFLDAALTAEEVESVIELLRRRVQDRVPAAYLTNEAWLGEFRFYVDERVIVPRSHIADLLRDGLAPWVSDTQEVKRVLDLCTGSGCLAIVAAHAFPDAQIDAVELSEDALGVARRNVADYGLEERVRLLSGDLFAPVTSAHYDVIVSNPPYVTAPAMDGLPAEYRAEPAMALAGGDDGLDLVRRIIEGARSHMTLRGLLVVEIGDNREGLEAAFPGLGFTWPTLPAGGERVFLLSAEQLGE